MDVLSLIFVPRRFYVRHKEGLSAQAKYWPAAALAMLVPTVAAALAHVFWAWYSSRYFLDFAQGLLKVGFDIFSPASLIWTQITDTVMGAVQDFSFGLVPLLVSVFFLILRFTAYATLVHVGARTMLPQLPQCDPKLTTTLKIAAFAQIPWVLSVIPLVGSVLACSLSLSAVATGVRTVYGGTYLQSWFTALFPYILTAMLGVTALLAVLTTVLGFLGLMVF